MKDVFTFLVGGAAGAGVKKAGFSATRLFARMGRHVFEMSDYPSLIKGGHNFNVVSTSLRPIKSHYLELDLAVALDKRSYDAHIKEICKGGIMVFDSDEVPNGKGIGIPLLAEAQKHPNPNLRKGIASITALMCALGHTKSELHKFIKQEYKRDLDHNCAYADVLYDLMKPQLFGKFKLKKGTHKGCTTLTGNECIALGAAAGGLDTYFGYPMTPASSILHFFAKRGRAIGVTTVHAENEIGAINMAVGAATVGARAAVGSSGGGVALMQETFSLAGIIEAPLLCVLASRPGPATGVPTYTSQGDLKFALNQGHGEFTRIVASPGSMEEAYTLSADMLDMCWKFQIPGMLVTEKHLSESRMTVDLPINKAAWAGGLMHKGGTKKYERYKVTKDGLSPMLFPPKKTELGIKWNSYEHTPDGLTTEVPKEVTDMIDKRNRKHQTLLKAMKKKKTVNVYGKSGPIIITYGSTTLSVLEALKIGKIKATVVQPVYLEPFPEWVMKKYKGRKVVVVEVSATGQFADLLKEKAGIKAKKVLLQYDGRPFEPMELAKKLKGVL